MGISTGRSLVLTRGRPVIRRQPRSYSLPGAGSAPALPLRLGCRSAFPPVLLPPVGTGSTYFEGYGVLLHTTQVFWGLHTSSLHHSQTGQPPPQTRKSTEIGLSHEHRLHPTEALLPLRMFMRMRAAGWRAPTLTAARDHVMSIRIKERPIRAWLSAVACQAA